MTALFVTATGTGVGKTYVTCALIEALRAAGRAVAALKPVVSGFEHTRAAESDSGLILKALGRPLAPAAIDGVSPWRFAAPISPDMAAAREGRTVPFAELVACCRAAIAAREDALLIEGVGGAMVPLDDRHTMRDVIAALEIPALVVAGSYLGTISHSLCTIEALAARAIPVRALVLSESAESPVPPTETAVTLARFTAVPIRILARGGGAPLDLIGRAAG